MNRITRYAKILEYVSIICAAFLIALPIATWLFDYMPSQLHNFCSLQPNMPTIQAMPLSHRVLGLLVDLVGLAIMLCGITYFIALMRTFKQGTLFSPTIISMLNKLSIIALIWALYYPIQGMALSLITSLHKGTGNRIIALGFGTQDLANIIIFSSFVLITALLQESYRLQEEKDLTI